MEKPIYEKYCCVVYWNGHQNVLDRQVFPNPDRDPTAIAKCREKAAAIRKAGFENVKPMVLTQIVEREDFDNLCDRLDSMNNHFGCGKIVDVHLDTETEGTVKYRVPITSSIGQLKTRRFRIAGNVLHYAGHKSTLTKPFRV